MYEFTDNQQERLDAISERTGRSIDNLVSLAIGVFLDRCERAHESTAKRFWAKVEKTASCWNWTAGTSPFGYGHFSRGRSTDPFHLVEKGISAHRYAYQLLVGPIPEGLVVRHLCDNPACVNPAHLKLGTQYENVQDRERSGRTAVGSRHGRSVLTEELVAEIRTRYVAGGVTARSLSAEYGVAKGAIQCILEYKSWKHVLPSLYSAIRERGALNRGRQDPAS